MSFRDDHDAALARAEALERDLAKSREESAAKSERLAASEREKARVEREKARIERELVETRARLPAESTTPSQIRTPPPAPTPPTGDPDPDRHVLRLLALVAVIIVCVVALAARGCDKEVAEPEAPIVPRETPKAPTNPMCELVTNPPGAELYASRGGGQVQLGTSPLQIHLNAILGEMSVVIVEARLAGHLPQMVVVSQLKGCPPTINMLASDGR